MRTQLTPLLLIAGVGFGCHQQHSANRPNSRGQAEALMAKIRPGMTLQEILNITPHESLPSSHTREHGGLWYDLPVSEQYLIQIRISPPQPGAAPERPAINYSPRLRDRKTLKFISGGEETW
jgi:hypothetical protein